MASNDESDLPAKLAAPLTAVPASGAVGTLAETLQAEDSQAITSQSIATMTVHEVDDAAPPGESGAGGGTETDDSLEVAEEAELIAQIDSDEEADRLADEDEVRLARQSAEEGEAERVEEVRRSQPSEDPRLQGIASTIYVTPAMVTAFKAENPFFAQMDDAAAGHALRDIIAAATLEAQDLEEARVAAGEAPAAETKPAYSLWSDIKSVPGAVAAGVAKSGFETYDAVNEIALGNAPSEHSEWRQGIEGYYDSTSGISGAAAVVAQFGAAFVGFGKLAKLAKVPGLATAAATRIGQIAQASAKGAAADFLAFDGMQGRLSDLVQQYPTLENPVTEFLATNPDDTSTQRWRIR